VRRLLITLACLVLAAPAAAAPAAPAFTVTRLDGSGHFDSRAQIGKHLLVVRFQASWCKVCNEEAAGIERLYQKYRTSGVEFVAIQVQDTEADARQFLKATRRPIRWASTHGSRSPTDSASAARRTPWSSTSAGRSWRASTGGPTRPASRASSIRS
jgi:thiol-disulfide isomerase/thioredoxin